MINIVLIESKTQGNIGAVARIMANFGFKDLILVNPRCKHLGKESLKRAKHAKQVLKKAIVVKSFNYLEKFDLVVGTTAITGTDYNIPRVSLSPEEFSKQVLKVKGKIALVFGRESSGLNNEEIQKCDFTTTINTSKDYLTMNISHSLAVFLYELFKQRVQTKKISLGSSKDKRALIKEIQSLIKKLEFSTEEKRDTQRKVWRRVIGKSFLTKRELYALFGFFKKLRP
jgi:TrmH family RNA methyltransferase